MKKNSIYYLTTILFFFIFSTKNIAQNVGINPTGASPDNSAMLDIVSPDKGLLIPRMDSTSRKNIVTPAEGLMVFDSTYNSFYFYDGTAWAAIGGGSDNLGNHIATQNLQLNGKWLNDDNNTDVPEGIKINPNGFVGVNVFPQNDFQVGIGKTPQSTFHVGLKTATPFPHVHQPLKDLRAWDVVDYWQSFTPTESGPLESITIDITSPGAINPTYTLYEGTGTGGTALYTNSTTGTSLPFNSLPLNASQVYTIGMLVATSDTVHYKGGNPYGGGTSDVSGLDFKFSVYMIVDAPGFKVDNNGVTINDYTFPLNDGSANQTLTTDGAGTVTWGNQNGIDNLGNHTATQNVQLNGNWLSDDGNDEGIVVTNVGKVGINRNPGTIGASMLELHGAGGNLTGPHVQAVTNTDNYPVFQQLNWTHDNVNMNFDAYYDGDWRSSSSTNNFLLYKLNGSFHLFYDSNVSQGGTVIWNTGFVVDGFGRFGIGRTPTTNKLEVEGEASKTTAGSWVANSDARLKKNITSLSSKDMLEKMLSLQGTTYEWNDTQTGTQRPEETQFGFIAQNIQEAFPTLVEEDNNGFLQTAYGTYDAMTVEAIRALNHKIEKLENENAALKTQLPRVQKLALQIAKLESFLEKDKMAADKLQAIKNEE